MKTKLKTLPKSLREIRRYIYIENTNIFNIKNKFIKKYGVFKFAESDFAIKNYKNNKIIRINNKFLNDLKIIFKDENIKILKISGTLKGLKI